MEEGADTVTPAIVWDNITRAVVGLRNRRLENLSEDVLAVYHIIECADEMIAPGEIYNQYCE